MATRELPLEPYGERPSYTLVMRDEVDLDPTHSPIVEVGETIEIAARQALDPTDALFDPTNAPVRFDETPDEAEDYADEYDFFEERRKEIQRNLEEIGATSSDEAREAALQRFGEMHLPTDPERFGILVDALDMVVAQDLPIILSLLTEYSVQDEDTALHVANTLLRIHTEDGISDEEAIQQIYDFITAQLDAFANLTRNVSEDELRVAYQYLRVFQRLIGDDENETRKLQDYLRDIFGRPNMRYQQVGLEIQLLVVNLENEPWSKEEALEVDREGYYFKAELRLDPEAKDSKEDEE